MLCFLSQSLNFRDQHQEQKVAMGDPQQHRDPIPKVPQEQPDRVLTPEQKRELTKSSLGSAGVERIGCG
jgi:hypothetical protein